MLFFNNLSGDLENLNFIDEIKKEDVYSREFIHYIHKNTVGRYLLA